MLTLGMAFKVLLFTQQPVLALGFNFALSGFAEVGAVNTMPLLLWSAADLSSKWDIIFLDMSGGITLNDLANISNDRAIVLLVESCHSAFAYQAIQLGVKGIFKKSFSIEQLKDCVREVSDGKGWFEPELLQEIVCGRTIKLSPRERQYAVLISKGYSNKQIAAELGLGEGTIKVYLSRLFDKLGVEDRYELALWALKNITASPESATMTPLPLNGDVLKNFMKMPGVPQMELADV